MTPFCRWGSEGRRDQAAGNWEKGTLAGSADSGPHLGISRLFCVCVVGAMSGVDGMGGKKRKVT